MKLNILSLFDGMSCGQQALERAGITVDNYFASEIDKYAIQVTMANYPDTKQLGSVVNVNGSDLPKIDLLIGGSPCQSFSFAGKRKGMATKCETEILTLDHYLELKSDGYEFEGQSYLFWEFMRLLNECKPKYFLLENVEMGEKWEKVLSKAIGVNGIHINSALVSAQNRKRIYWTNIGMQPGGLFGDLVSIIQKPKDKGILLKDILQDNPCPKTYLSEKEIEVMKFKAHQQDEVNYLDGKARTLVAGSHGNSKHYTKTIIPVDEKYFLSDKMLNHFNNKLSYSNFKFDFKPTTGEKKGACLTALMEKMPITQDYIVALTEVRTYEAKQIRKETGSNPKRAKELIERTDGKTYCLDTGNTNAVEILGGDFRQDEGFRWRDNGKSASLLTKGDALLSINTAIRRLTPLECERLQTVKDNYTNHVSDSQRYKMLGNGWTVDVIAHIFSYLK